MSQSPEINTHVSVMNCLHGVFTSHTPYGEEERVNFLYLKIYILEQFIQLFTTKKNENNGNRLPSTVGISLLMEGIMWH
jgi:hypothetical protein